MPALPYRNPNQYVHYSRRLAEALAKTEPDGAIWANQWDNTANRQAHIETTSQEIWSDTDGKVDGFVSAVGSGGTLGGCSDGSQGQAQVDPDRARRRPGRGPLRGFRPKPHAAERRTGSHAAL